MTRFDDRAKRIREFRVAVMDEVSAALEKTRKVNITITTDGGLAWYKSSDIARRGFCRECGSSLFWEPYELDATGIIAGSLDKSANLKTVGHIFVAEKPDFYEISDALPQFEGSSDGELVDDYK